MSEEVIAVFDIGKTNKKVLLFNEELNPVYEEEVRFDETTDEDGFACDDINRLEAWMKSCLDGFINKRKYFIKVINISTYGASLMYIDQTGKRLTPVYNYLKPMPEKVLEGFYEQYGGIEEFCRKTASPALGMLNSGLQIRWLKRTKPEIFTKVSTILHLPQYLSFLLTGKGVSDYTSLGCHTAMWDFDAHAYHRWLSDEGIRLPDPVPNDTLSDSIVYGSIIKTGIGIHDSSASLVPYFNITDEKFLLISTGTWCIFMNPFNNEPLTAQQLRKDTLCYMSIRQRQVKSSRLFMGHLHDVNIERISRYFGVNVDFYKTIKTSDHKISRYTKDNNRVFFVNGIPEGYIDLSVDLNRFLTFDEAYHQLMADLVNMCMDSIRLILSAADETKVVYITGGFARNEIFTRLLSGKLPGKKVYVSEMNNATALGAAMVVWNKAFAGTKPDTDPGLKLVKELPINNH